MDEHTLRDLLVTQVAPSRWQYRRRWDEEGLLELAKSIELHGIVVRLLVFEDEDGGYELIAGERRLRAMQALQLKQNGIHRKLADAVAEVAAADWWGKARERLNTGTRQFFRMVPVEVKEGEPEGWREVVILENLQRENPSAVEEAEGFRILLEEEGYTQTKLAQRLSKSQGYVSQRMGLLGLAEEVKEVVQDQDISFTAARSIATLPEEMQGAVTSQVQQMAQIEGDGQATTRKVQVMASQIKRFMKPESWEPNSFNRMLPPVVRNRLRLIQWHMGHLDKARAGEVVVALRDVRDYGYSSNYTGKKPLSMARDGIETGNLLDILTGSSSDPWGADKEHWRREATARGWTCEGCIFSKARKPEKATVDLPCERWEGDDVPTCLGFIGEDDPVVAVLDDWQVREWIRKLELEVQRQEDGLEYVDDLETYVAIVEQIAEAALAEDDERRREKEEGHLVDLRAYWEAQQDVEASGLDVVHFQAQACVRCAHCRPELMDEELPPCKYAKEPLLASGYNKKAKAPAMGVMVEREGTMVPRCAQFRQREVPTIVPVLGFSVAKGKRHMVLNWLRGVSTGLGYANNSTKITGVLHWLPWERKEEEENHDVDRVVTYVRQNWDGLGGDGAVATLVSVALSEAKARYGNASVLKLLNPTTGHEESWRHLGWAQFVNGVLPMWSSWPKDWPTPWMVDIVTE
jgi:ParB-like chromosome segregation protein Spo0J